MGKTLQQIVAEQQAQLQKSYKQETLFSKYQIPEDLRHGVCLAFCARFLMDTTEFNDSLGKQKFEIDTMRLYDEYKAKWKASGMAGDAFIEEKYGKKIKESTPALVLQTKRPDQSITGDGRYLIGLTGDGGHALGVIKSDKSYWVFDPNDGVAYCNSKEQFESLLYDHIYSNYYYKPYKNFYVTRWE